MNTLLPTIQSWINEKKSFALARVIQTWGSSPRQIGAAMIISSNSEMAGSVSGGCVENAVVKSALECIKDNRAEVVHFGVSDEDAWEVGLSCGGKISVFIQPFFTNSDTVEEQAIWHKLALAINNNEGCILVTKLATGISYNTLIMPDKSTTGEVLNSDLISLALEAYESRKNEIVEYNNQRYFVNIFPRKQQLLIIGAAHLSSALVELAKLFNFEVAIIDPRTTFANRNVFKVAPDKIYEKYPSEVLDDFKLDAYTYAAVLSHDPKIDDNALNILLKSDIAYIGVLGSRKTHAKRVARLNALGFDDELLNKRLNAPIGININAKSPEEIALSIISKIIEVKNQFR